MNNYKFFALLLLITVIFACKGTREGIKQDYQTTRDDVVEAVTKSPEEVQKEKTELASKLEAQEYKINQSLRDIGDRDFTEEQKNNAEFASQELEQLLERVEKSTEEIAKASTEDWNQVKDKVEDELNDIEDDREALVKTLYADLE